MLGALAAPSSALPGGRRAWALAALALSAFSTGAMGYFSLLPAFLVLRFIGGGASAFALLFAPPLVMDRLSTAGPPALIALYFFGVGTGILVLALLVAGVAAAGLDWRNFWIASGALSLLGVAAVARLVPDVADTRAPVPAGGLRIGRPLLALIAAYGLFGFGYVITATFISAIVRSAPELNSLEPVIWLLVGLGAIPSVAFWAWVGRRIGNGRSFAIACLAEAGGITLSVVAGGPAPVGLFPLGLGGTSVRFTATGPLHP